MVEKWGEHDCYKPVYMYKSSPVHLTQMSISTNRVILHYILNYNTKLRMCIMHTKYGSTAVGITMKSINFFL